MSYSPDRPSRILAAHKNLDDVNQDFLLIADRQDVANEGLLCVNLDFKGAPDAVREKAQELRYALPSLSIDNTDWVDDILTNAERPLYPRAAFAMLVHPSTVARRNAADVVDVVDGGLGGRRRGTGTVLAVCEDVDTDDVNAMTWHFSDSCADKGWQGDYFLCVGGETVHSSKVETVSARTQKRRSYTWEIAGEILVWLAVGLVREEDCDEPGDVEREQLAGLSYDS